MKTSVICNQTETLSVGFLAGLFNGRTFIGRKITFKLPMIEGGVAAGLASIHAGWPLQEKPAGSRMAVAG